jgi:hypothetical protein
MIDHAINPSILNRKKQMEQDLDDMLTCKNQGHGIRSKILLSRGDSLTDEDLRNHHKELRFKKFTKLVWAIPVLEYYFIKMRRGPLYSIPLTYLLYIGLNHFYYFKTQYTYGFALKAEKQHLNTVLNFNLQKLATPNDRWNWRNNAISYAEWVARNEYK